MSVCFEGLCVFFFKQKTAYEMRISDLSSDVCSSDLPVERAGHGARPGHDFLRDYAGADRRLRKLVRAADDRGPRHGLPAHEQHLFLAARARLAAAAGLGLRG